MQTSHCEEVIAKLSLMAPVKVTCRNWDGNPLTQNARGYFFVDNSSPPEIILLPERLRSEGEVLDTLKHELVHAFDYCELKQDLSQCEGLACSEIRAVREVECHVSWCPLPSSLCEKLKQRCVKKKAIQATSAIFSTDQASACVKSQFEACYHDLRMYKS